MKKVLVIIGPTCVGKSSIAVECAKKLNGEIISADSAQIYKHMNIGTAKISREEMCNIPHHMISILEPNLEYSVAQYVKDVKKVIASIIKKGKTPIIVGGTGLYIKSLINDYDFANTIKNPELRARLKIHAERFGTEKLYSTLKSINSKLASKISMNDEKRIIRALEICLSDKKQFTEDKPEKYEYKIYALNLDREKLYNRINSRVDDMCNDGLQKEVEKLLKSGIQKNCQSLKAIGYKEFIAYLEGSLPLNETINLIKQHTRNYAKRQLTFNRGIKEAIWLDIEKDNIAETITKEFKNEY